MPNVGKLVVDLEARTATFTGPLGKARQMAEGDAKGIQDAFNDIDLHEANGSFKLIMEDLGIHMPRHLSTFISSISGLDKLLAAAFIPVAIITLGKVLFETYEKFTKYREEVAALGAEHLKNAEAVEKHAESLRLANLRLDDQIAKLNKGITKNSFKEALIEVNEKTKELIATLTEATKKEEELFEKASHNFFVQGILDAFTDNKGINDIRDKAQPLFEAIQELKREQETLMSEADQASTAAEKKRLQDRAKEIGAEATAQEKKLRDMFRTSLEETETAKRNDLNAKTKGLGDISSFPTDTPSQRADKKAHEDYLAGVTKSVTENYKTRVEALRTALITMNAMVESEKQLEEWTRKTKTEAALKDKLAGVEIVPIGKGKLAEEVKKQKEEQAKDENEAAHILAEINERDLHTAQARAAVQETIAKQLETIDHLSAAIALSEEEHKINLAAASGILTKQEKDQQLLALYAQAEQKEQLRVNALLHDRQAILDSLNKKTMGGMTGTDADKAAYQKALLDCQKFTEEKLKLDQQYEQKKHQREIEAAATEQAQWRKMAQEWGHIQKQMSEFGMHTLDSLNSSVAQFVATGKLDFQSLAQGAIQSFVMMALQYGESKLLMMALDKIFHVKKGIENTGEATSNVAVAATEALASVPWPFNMAAAAETEAAGAAFIAQAGAAMAFQRGGLVPGTGNGDIVPAMLEPGERVLTREENRLLTTNSSRTSSFTSKPSININVAPGADAKSIAKATERAVRKASRAEIRKMRFLN